MRSFGMLNAEILKLLRPLSDQARVLFVTLWGHPNMTSIGALVESDVGLANYAGWPIEKVKQAALEAEELVRWDPAVWLWWVRDATRIVPPVNPNMVRGCMSSANALPVCQTKWDIISTLIMDLEPLANKSESMAKAVADVQNGLLKRYRETLLQNGLEKAFLATVHPNRLPHGFSPLLSPSKEKEKSREVTYG